MNSYLFLPVLLIVEPDYNDSNSLQVAALPLLQPERVHAEKLALQKHFHHKRDHVLERLANMGLPVKNPPVATFYIWLDLSALPSPLNHGLVRSYTRLLTVDGGKKTHLKRSDRHSLKNF